MTLRWLLLRETPMTPMPRRLPPITAESLVFRAGVFALHQLGHDDPKSCFNFAWFIGGNRRGIGVIGVSALVF